MTMTREMNSRQLLEYRISKMLVTYIEKKVTGASEYSLNSLLGEFPIIFTDLPEMVQNALRGSGIWTVGELVRQTEAQLKTYPQLGKISIQQIKDMLLTLNLELKED